jgi:hypothetical protein
MMHPGLETLWKSPPSAFFGKKCYKEMEKRDRPCPHCPGVVAMRTGMVAEGEGTALLDDGTRVPFLLRAYPVVGTDGKPVGWVEVVESLAARRQQEEHARFQIELVNALLETSSMSTVLRLGLDAALRLQGVESGCAYEVDPNTGAAELVIQRGVAQVDIGDLSPGVVGSAISSVVHGDHMHLTVPIVYRARPVAALVLRYPRTVWVAPASGCSWRRSPVFSPLQWRACAPIGFEAMPARTTRSFCNRCATLCSTRMIRGG